MIYCIYKQKDLIAETDSLDFAKSVVKQYPGCTIKDVETDKVFKVNPDKKL